MSTILILEDDLKLNNGIRLALKNEKDSFIQCRKIQEAREWFAKNQPDLILLDVNLPDGNGMDFLVEIRKKSNVPVILLTVNNMETDIVTGLELGANDYITKPFSLMVLRARVGVQLRDKKEHREKRNQYQGKEYLFDFDKLIYQVRGQEIELSRTEEKILKLLLEHQGATLKRSRIIDEVWAGDTEYVEEHALTVAMKRLRDKIEANPKAPVYIKTVYGIGYTWVVEG